MIILSPHGCGDNPKQCGDSGDKLTRRVPQACPSLPLVCESVFAARKAPTTRPHRTRQLTPTAEALSWSSSRSTGHRAPSTRDRSGQARPGKQGQGWRRPPSWSCWRPRCHHQRQQLTPTAEALSWSSGCTATEHQGQAQAGRQGPALEASMPPRTKAAHPFPWCVSLFLQRVRHPPRAPHRTRQLTPTAGALPRPGRHHVAPGTGHRAPEAAQAQASKGQGWRRPPSWSCCGPRCSPPAPAAHAHGWGAGLVVRMYRRPSTGDRAPGTGAGRGQGWRPRCHLEPKPPIPSPGVYLFLQRGRHPPRGPTAPVRSRPRLRRCPGRQVVPHRPARDQTQHRAPGTGAGRASKGQGWRWPPFRSWCWPRCHHKRQPLTPTAGALAWSSSRSTGTARETGQATGPGLKCWPAWSCWLPRRHNQRQRLRPTAGAARPGRQDVPQARRWGKSTRDRRRQGPGLAASMPPRTKAAHLFPWCVCLFLQRGRHPPRGPTAPGSSRLPLKRCPGRHPVAPGTRHRAPGAAQA
jgi:hypothetical protein